jgi:TRAP-type mannitol/chloroaromatic compound transport system permease small subunit
MEWIAKASSAIDRFNEWVGQAVSWLTLIMVLVVVVDVVMRYLFKKSYMFVQELEWHLFGLIFLLGAGYTLLHDAHVRVDIFYQKLSRKGKAWVNLICTLLFLFPGCYLVISSSIPFLMNSWAIREGSGDPGGMPARYLLKAAIPVGFGLIALQGVSWVFKNVLIVTGHPAGAEEGERS